MRTGDPHIVRLNTGLTLLLLSLFALLLVTLEIAHDRP